MPVRAVFLLVLLMTFPGVASASPWATLMLPWVFGQEFDGETTPGGPMNGRGFRELAFSSQPLVDSALLNLSTGIEESVAPDAESLAAECLKSWREVWHQGRFDLAVVLARKAVAYHPRSLDAQHALVISEIVLSADNARKMRSAR